jgi:hypothetical protein
VNATVHVKITREGELEPSGAVNEEILRSLLRVMRETIGVR